MKKQGQSDYKSSQNRYPGSVGNPGNTGNPGKIKNPGKSSVNGGNRSSDENRDLDAQRIAKLRAVDKRRARSRSVTMTFFALLIVTAAIFIINNIVNKTAPKPQFMFIQKGTLEHTSGATALLVREEVLMKSPAAGTVKPLIEEGNRVSFGQNIAMIIGTGADTTLNELQNCEQQISDLQIDLINEGKGPGARVIYDETNEDIAELVDLARKESIQGALINMDSYQTSITVLMERRDTRLLAIDFKDSRLTELKKQKTNLEKSLGTNSGTIVSKNSGIVSYHLDGLEESLSFKKIASITVDQYKKEIEKSNLYLTTTESVKKNDSVLRITTGIYQYIVMLLPDTSAASFKKGSIHTVKVPLDGTEIGNCSVVRAVQTGNDLFIIFKTDRQLDRFSDRRTIQTDIAIKKTEGLRIPYSSIQNFDKTNSTGEIMIVSGGYTRKAKIKVLDYDREYAIIEAVKGGQYTPALYSYLVKNPESVKEGENIGD